MYSNQRSSNTESKDLKVSKRVSSFGSCLTFVALTLLGAGSCGIPQDKSNVHSAQAEEKTGFATNDGAHNRKSTSFTPFTVVGAPSTLPMPLPPLSPITCTAGKTGIISPAFGYALGSFSARTMAEALHIYNGCIDYLYNSCERDHGEFKWTKPRLSVIRPQNVVESEVRADGNTICCISPPPRPSLIPTTMPTPRSTPTSRTTVP